MPDAEPGLLSNTLVASPQGASCNIPLAHLPFLYNKKDPLHASELSEAPSRDVSRRRYIVRVLSFFAAGRSRERLVEFNFDCIQADGNLREK